jgi:hypothetical protein
MLRVILDDKFRLEVFSILSPMWTVFTKLVTEIKLSRCGSGGHRLEIV